MFMVQLKKEHFFFAVRALQWIIAHSQQKALAPGVEIKKNPVLRFVNCLGKFTVNFTMSCIKTIVSGHLEILFRDMLDKQFDKIYGRKSCFDESIIFMPVIMKSHVIPIVGIDPGKSNDRTPKIAADIFDNGFWITEIWLGVNIKAVFVFAVYFRFGFFERDSNLFFQLIQ